MNIVKLQQQLQKIPDQALIGYVQDPNSQVPSYLALAELSRRKEIRQSAAPKQPAPTQTVAQQAVAESQPGIAQLPVPDNMFNEQSMAAGGIVSFEEGGEVPRFAQGGMPEFDPMQTLLYSDYMKLSPQQKLAHQGKVLYMGDEDIQDPTGQGKVRTGFIAGMYDKLGIDKRINPTYDAPKGQKKSDFKLSKPENPFGAAFGGDDINSYVERVSKDPKVLEKYKEEKRKERENTLRPYDEVVRDIRASKAVESPFAVPQRDIVPLNYDRPTNRQIIEATNSRDQQPPRDIPSATGGIGSLKWEDIKADTQGYRDIMRPEVSAKDKMEEMRELLGTDPARAAMQDRLAKMEARTAREEERAPWMALAEAGLGIAGGKSQFAIQNIAEGSKAGVSSLIAARERVNNAKEKQFELANRMAQAERAEQVAAAKFGQESAEAIKARNDQVKLAEQSNKNEISLKNAVGKFEAQKGNAEIQLKKADLAQSAAANSAKLKMMERQILSQGLASQARLAAIRQKALAELKNNESYGLQLNAIAAKYKDSGGVQNPMYKQEVKALENEFMANALETIFDSGLGANALSADSIVPLGD
jgi:hypothetical protein